jgi:hypothetical protein
MAPSDGSNVDHDIELDDDDLAPEVRRFLQSIADGDSAVSRADRRKALDRERRVTRFAWTCEELNVAFGDLRLDDTTRSLIVEHGVRETLEEIRAKCEAMLDATAGVVVEHETGADA